MFVDRVASPDKGRGKVVAVRMLSPGAGWVGRDDAKLSEEAIEAGMSTMDMRR